MKMYVNDKFEKAPTHFISNGASYVGENAEALAAIGFFLLDVPVPDGKEIDKANSRMVLKHKTKKKTKNHWEQVAPEYDEEGNVVKDGGWENHPETVTVDASYWDAAGIVFKDIAKPTVNKKELNDYVYDLKAKTAYECVFAAKDGIQYTFATDPQSIGMINSTLLAFQSGAASSVEWKVYNNGTPKTIEISAAEFAALFGFGMNLISTCFSIEGELNAEIEQMTDEQLVDSAHIAEFKARAEAAFGAVNRTFEA